jgi:polyisoprenoid-binding protein YceI
MRLALVLLSLAAAVPAASAPQVLTLQPEGTKVSFFLEATGHDVEGLLALKSGAVRFDPATGEASGELVVDLATAATGNKSRDKTMHREVLEDDRFPLAVFRATRFRGSVPQQGDADFALDGVMTVHGADHPVEVTGKLHAAGGKLAAEVEFPVPFVEWGMHDPSWFVLSVAKVVKVHVHAEGELKAAAE